MGIEGYGIYFMLLEVLRSQTNYKFPKSQISSLVFDFHCSRNKLLRVINEFDLFKIDEENNFYSQRLIDYLQPYIEKSKRARDAINKRWGNTNEIQMNDTNEIQKYPKMDTINKANINKESKRLSPPFGSDEYWEEANRRSMEEMNKNKNS